MTLAELIANVERLFDCRNGDHRAYHTEHSSDCSVNNAPAMSVGICDCEGKNWYYKSLAIIAGPEVPNREEALRLAMNTSFEMLHKSCNQEKPILYWRYAEEQRIGEEEDFTGLVKIWTRVAIPNADWSVVEVKEEGALTPRLKNA